MTLITIKVGKGWIDLVVDQGLPDIGSRPYDPHSEFQELTESLMPINSEDPL